MVFDNEAFRDLECKRETQMKAKAEREGKDIYLPGRIISNCLQNNQYGSSVHGRARVCGSMRGDQE